MSALGKREQLEAAVHAQLTRAWKYGLAPGDRPKPHEVIMNAAEAYASAVAAELLDAMARDRRESSRRTAIGGAS